MSYKRWKWTRRFSGVLRSSGRTWADTMRAEPRLAVAGVPAQVLVQQHFDRLNTMLFGVDTILPQLASHKGTCAPGLVLQRHCDCLHVLRSIFCQPSPQHQPL
ncbi:hypothetical protein [Anthocerotibacter panamensis]|uniref:hypothetical protein n=1 Tax=Anthocerotibacter panamensis TaxID=2857077 RepID=UPI001C403F71|nr:hypothetical protein [Anthocerotibacter panamensis]